MYLTIIEQAKGKQLWVSLVEKAIAKFYGTYSYMQNEYLSAGLTILTGAAAEYTSLSEYLTIIMLMMILMAMAIMGIRRGLLGSPICFCLFPVLSLIPN